jgi:hypothetical protein
MNQKSFLTGLGGWLLVAALLSPLLSQQLRAENNPPAPMKLKVGDQAPDFKLQFFDGSNLKDVSLSQYRGKKNVVVAFYIFAFTGG